jgi:outer membrane protein, heavy metal efflux system
LRARILIACTAVGSSLLAGCASRPPDVQTESSALNAVSTHSGEPLVFRTIGDPIDVPTSQPADRLTLDEAVRWSVLRSPTLQAALARVRIAQAEAQQSRLLPNPVLSVAVRFPEAGVGKPIIDAGLTADLISVLRRPGAITAADARLRAASAEAVTVALDIATQAQERFYAIQSLEASLAVLRERGGLLQRLLDLAESRLRIGEGTKLDVVTLQTQRVELDAEIADK